MYSHKRVLVALDGSTACEAVLRLLMEIAGPLDMTVMLLHVLEPITPAAAAPPPAQTQEAATKRDIID